MAHNKTTAQQPDNSFPTLYRLPAPTVTALLQAAPDHREKGLLDTYMSKAREVAQKYNAEDERSNSNPNPWFVFGIDEELHNEVRIPLYKFCTTTAFPAINPHAIFTYNCLITLVTTLQISLDQLYEKFRENRRVIDLVLAHRRDTYIARNAQARRERWWERRR